MLKMIRFARFMKGQKGLTPTKALSFVYHLPSMLRLIARLLRDQRVPSRLKIYCGLAVLYLLSPIDVLPDLLLPVFGLGVVDDISLIFLAFNKLIKDTPQHIVDEHVQAIGRTSSPPLHDRP